MKAYEFLSEWFEMLNDDCDYALWSQYFIDGLSRYDAGKKGLELGCGSGAFCRALTKRGYLMTGADCSEAMLSKGLQLAREEGLVIPFLRLDAANFRTPEKFDFILSPNDCYNYIAGEKLAGAFRAAARALVKNGLFWFDVSSPCKLREKVANTVSVDDRDEVTYLSFNSAAGDRIRMDVSLFVRGNDGRYTRCEETHTQYIHERDFICRLLNEAGFEILAVEGHLGEAPERSDRMNFICRKVKS